MHVHGTAFCATLSPILAGVTWGEPEAITMNARNSSVRFLIVAAALLVAAPAGAGPYADAMAGCLADNTTGKERKELARWIFAAMAAHPEMRDLSSSTPATRDRISQSIGALITRLLTENCAEQTRNAMAKEGSQSLETAFGSLGQLAMQELMSNQDVNAAISEFERYIDSKKIEASLATP